MPEGHTIHRLARDLNRSFKGRRITASSPQGRFDGGAARLNGQVCERFEAHGKHLVGRFGADVLHVHLGLIGKFNKTTGDPVGQVRLRLASEAEQWDLRGPMVCRLGDPDLIGEVRDSVGPDPLRDSRKRDAPDRFAELLGRRRIAIGAALLDQKVIAGIGNVYRAELLFLLGIDPTVPANRLSDEQVTALWDLAVTELRRGAKANRIVTVDVRDMGYKSVRSIPRSESVYVYKRGERPCRVCSTTIEELEVGGRKIWRCPTCQPSP